MNLKKRIVIILSIDMICLIVISIILPTVIFDKSVGLIQCVVFSLLFSFIAYVHYKRVNHYLLKLIKHYGLSEHKSERQSLTTSVHVLKEEFFEGQTRAKRYQKINKTLNLAIEVNNEILKSRDVQEIYDFILKKAIQAIDKSDKGSIMLLNDHDELEFISLVGFSDSFFKLKIPKEEAFLYKMTDGALDKAIIVDNVVEFNRRYMTIEDFNIFYEEFPMGYQTALSAPIRFDDTFLGVINLDSDNVEGFNEEDLAIMDLFASQLEVTIGNKNLMDKILYLSRFDKLTDAYNRSYFEEIIEAYVKTPERAFALVVIDIDDLKAVNDEFGHLEGDHLLIVFAKMVKKNIRITDHFARIGGDEFILLFTQLRENDIKKICIRIMQDLEEYTIENKMKYKISFSYGISLFPEESDSADGLYLKSDQRMYKMKRGHKENK